MPTGTVDHDQTDLPAAAVYFPVVGFFVGAMGALAFGLAAELWPPALAAILSVGFTVWLTGAFHEDALADAFDGFGGGWDTAQVLSIMKDSRVGSYALVGVLLVMAAKVGALVTIVAAAPASDGVLPSGAAAVGRGLIAAHTLGRWSSVALMATHDYVRVPRADERASAGVPFAGRLPRARFATASAIALTIVLLALGRQSLGVAIVAGSVTWLGGRYFDRRIGGITGDALGAANQFVELAVYLTLAAR